MATNRLFVGFTVAAALALLLTVVTPLRAAAVQALATVTCASALACTGGNNTSTGPGVQGTSAKGKGVVGQTKSNSNSTNGQSGVLGQDLSTSSSFNAGVTGTSQKGNGVVGRSTDGDGVHATSQNGKGLYGSSIGAAGVYGFSANGSGIVGQSNGGLPAVYAFNSSGNGVEAHTDSSDAVHAVTSSNGTAVAALSTSGNAIYATTGGGVGAFIFNSGGNGAEISGSYIGAVVRAPVGVGAFPLVATDPSGSNLFYVNGNGDVYYHGTLNHFAATRNNTVASAYVANTTTPTVEDSGTAKLINGQATVRLDGAFAQTIDSTQAYHVLLTPDGDTRGLFVATKSPGEFVVREIQGGRDTLSFDYHIYARAFGHANERMVLRSAAAAAALLPKAKPPAARASKSTHPIIPRK